VSYGCDRNSKQFLFGEMIGSFRYHNIVKTLKFHVVSYILSEAVHENHNKAVWCQTELEVFLVQNTI